jgi:hypothetical protein
MASGRFPSLPFEAWKPRPERPRISGAKVRLDGVLIMLGYGLRVMSDVRLSSLAGILQNELDQNEQRWVPHDVQPVQRGLEQINQERGRRRALLNPAERLHHWFVTPKTSPSWTRQDADNLRGGWETLVTQEEPS